MDKEVLSSNIDKISTTFMDISKLGKSKIKSYIKLNTNIIIAFSSYFFSFLLLEQIINNNVGIKLGLEYVLIIYSISAVFSALGYFSYSVIGNKLDSNKNYLWILGVLFGIFNISNVIIDGQICILTSLLASYILGIIGASIHYQLSLNTINNNNIGKTIGISITIALILQMLVYCLITNILFLSIVITLGSFVSVGFITKNKSLTENIKTIKKNNGLSKSNFVLPILTVIIISIIIGLQDGVITHIDSIGKINVYGIPRIFYIIGILIAGYIADKKNGKYLSIVTIFWVFIAICGIVFLKNEKLYIINVALIFLLGGFYVMYLTIKFIKIAPYTKSPKLWAGMGRIVRSIATSLVVIPSYIILRLYGNEHLIIISIMFSTILLITLYKELSNIFVKEYKDSIEKIKNNIENEIEQKVKERQSIDIEDFINKYKFTQKEKEVCILILKENKKTKGISEDLYISERSVQRHLTNIYRKTNTSSRNELYNLFYKV